MTSWKGKTGRPSERMASTEQVTDGFVLSAAAEFACYPPSKEQSCWAVASLRAPLYEPTSRSPVDIAAVIDKSGSMRGTKLEMVKKTLLFIIDQLKECDRLSLVTYDTNVTLEFGLTSITKANKDQTKLLIQSIKDGSDTNLCGGLMEGMHQIILTAGQEGRAQVQSVLLLTDGLVNRGVKSKDGILGEMRKLQSPPAGRHSRKFEGTVYTFGFGSDHDSSLLEAISTQGGGVYYYIDSNEKIPESFADCLGGLLSVVGQNLSLKLEAQGGNTITAVHANRTFKWTTANKTCEIPLGDIQSEEERDIVLELKLPVLPSPQPDTTLVTTLSYFNVITSALDTLTTELTVNRTNGERGAPNVQVDTQRNRIIATAALKKAEPLADQGNLAEAKQVLKDAIATLEGSVTAKSDFCKALTEDLKRSLGAMKTREEYLGHGKLYICSKSQSHSFQRSSSIDHHAFYQNTSKTLCRRASQSTL